MAEQESIEILADRVEKIACANCKHHLDISSLPLFTLFNCPECHAQQMVPGKLGNFILLEELGRGGMGAVYRGQDMALGRPVAIKVMHKSLGDDPQFLETFLREARAAAAINHKNVVQIFSFGREKGQPYLIMELVDGGRLDAYIASSQTLTEMRALEVCLDVAEGLKAAHDVGLMHGDIKPANILFDQKGMAKVADFGLASFIHAQKAGSRDIWGTPFYIAPEKARRQKVDQRADIYSLGATMFHAMTIKPPFDGDTPTHVVLARLQLPPPDISTMRTALHPETVRIINRMLAPDPAVRYPNYASLISDLQATKDKLAGASAPAGQRKEITPGPGKLGLYLAVGGVALLALVAGVWLFAAKGKKKVAPPTPAVVVTSTVAVTPAVVPATKIVRDALNPFSADESRLIVEAVQPLARGDVTVVVDRLELLRLNVCTNQLQQQWLRIFQAIAWQVDHRQTEIERLLTALPLPPPPVTNVTNEVARLPLVTAQFLLHKLNKESLEALPNEAPAWCRAFIQFLQGWRIWISGNMRAHAVEKFKVYSLAVTTEAGWAYAFKPLTDNWVKQWDEFNPLVGKIRDLTHSQKFAAVHKLLDDFRVHCVPLQYNVTGPYLRALDAAEKAAQRGEVPPADETTDTPVVAKKPAPQPQPAKPAPQPQPKPEPVIPPATLTAAWASSETQAEPARLAMDGNFQTRWVSQLRDNQWLAVDLGQVRNVTGVVLYWDAARAVDYKIQVSRDRTFWTDALKVANSDGGREVKIFNAAVPGRYVRIYCLIREFKHPHVALFEVQVLVDGQKAPPPP
ncbi:MAG: hypothetical protein EPN23_00420 [Verrucomicrobia bacterium]|nr:MAG: hypothetical protein EPN23_00420 [Verrucomicrobiota bacterium]